FAGWKRCLEDMVRWEPGNEANSSLTTGNRRQSCPMPSDRFILFQDGNAWCAAPPGFLNYSEDPSGWGDTPAKAIQDLLKVPEFQERAREKGWPEPKLADFKTVAMP